jgi:hypothetical protein
LQQLQSAVTAAVRMAVRARVWKHRLRSTHMPALVQRRSVTARRCHHAYITLCWKRAVLTVLWDVLSQVPDAWLLRDALWPHA